MKWSSDAKKDGSPEMVQLSHKLCVHGIRRWGSYVGSLSGGVRKQYRALPLGIWFRFEQVLGVLDFYIFGVFSWFLLACLWVVCRSLEGLEVVLPLDCLPLPPD